MHVVVGTIGYWTAKQHLYYFKKCSSEEPNTGTRKPLPWKDYSFFYWTPDLFENNGLVYWSEINKFIFQIHQHLTHRTSVTVPCYPFPSYVPLDWKKNYLNGYIMWCPILPGLFLVVHWKQWIGELLWMILVWKVMISH